MIDMDPGTLRKVIKPKEAAKMLKFSARTLQRYRLAGKIPAAAVYRIGNKIMYYEDEIIQIVNNGGISKWQRN